MARTKASAERTAWQYTDDSPTDWNIQAKTAYVVGDDSAKFGGEAAAAANDSIPNGFKPRRVRVVSAAGDVRWPVVYTTSATLWTTPGTTVTMDIKGVDTVMTCGKTKRAERAERQPLILPS